MTSGRVFASTSPTRSWRSASFALPAVVALSCLAHCGGQNVWVTDQDTEAARKADAATKLYCSGGFKGKVNPEDDRKVLNIAMGKTNRMLEVLQGTQTQDELPNQLQDKLVKPPIPGAECIIVALALLILWIIFCWTCCPCCRCCRVCEKRRRTSKWCKIPLLLAAFLLFAGTLVAAAVASTGYDRAVAGFDNLACTAATLVNGTLGGRSAAPQFLGMIPLLNQFYTIEKNLAYSSFFMTGVRDKIDSTKAISNSVTMASEVLNLLQDAFKNIPADVVAKHHKCEFCNILQPVLAQTSTALSQGVGSALKNAREEVNKQLGPSSSAELQKALRDAATPLTEVKKLLRDSGGVFTNMDAFMMIRNQLEGPAPGVKIIIGLIILFAILLGWSAVFTLLWFLCRENIGTMEVTDEKGDPIPRPSRTTHRLACCTWCCGWVYAFAAFLIGGILLLLASPLSGLCLIMDDLSVELVVSIAPALGVNFTGPQGAQTLAILDQCVLNRNASANPMLLDLIYTTDAAGKPQTMRQRVAGQVKDTIQAQFNAVDAKLSSGSNATLATSPEVKQLVSMIANNWIDMLMIADMTYDWRSDADLKDLFLEPTLADALPSSIRCDTGTVSADTPTLGNQTILGVENFVTKLSAFGTRASTPGCADAVVCNPAGSSNQLLACKAGNNFVNLKRDLQVLTTFRCDVFLEPGDNVSDCDPLNMIGTQVGGVTTYSSSCQYPDGSMKRKVKNCNLDDFVNYIQTFGARINKTMVRVDSTVKEVGSGITVGLRQLVEEYILQPIQVIVDGVTCGFLSKDYRSLVEGLCFQGVFGFFRIGQSYVACGSLALFTVALMYGLWRRTLDNVNTAQEAGAGAS